MKKHLLLFIIGLLTSSAIYAQSLEIMNPDGSELEKQDSVVISTTDNTSEIEVPLYVKNISGVSKEVYAKLYVKQSVSGSSAQYCWNSCFDISTTQSTEFLTVNAGDTIKEFHSALSPNGNNGITEIMYTFFVNKDDADSVSVTIIYDILSTGINELSDIKESIKAYPNPVQNTIYLNYDVTSSSNCDIIIYDIVGKKIISQQLDIIENTTEVDVSDFKTGVYIWTFEKDGVPIKSDKFIKK